MALTKITYTDKTTLSPQPSVADVNKVSDSDMNEIKSVVNAAIDQIDENTSVHTYSTSETEVGTWIDGKTIYRKCFSQNDLSNIATGVNDIDSLIKMECLIKQTTTGDWRNLPWLYSGGQAGWQGGFFYKAYDQSVSFQVGSDLGQVQKTILIMEYTKTS